MKKKKILYRDWVCEWLKDKKNYVKESTYANYSNIVINHLIPEIGHYKLKDIEYKILQDLIIRKYKSGRIDNNGGLSDKTVRDIVAVIKLTFRSAFKNGLIDYFDLNFDFKNKNTNNRVYIFSKKEQNKIINYVMKNLNIQNICILLTLYSGIRIGELCALKWKDIDFNKNILSVNKTLQRIYLKESGESKVIITNPKTKNANREIPINGNFALLLKKFKVDDNSYILSGNNKFLEPRTYRKYYNNMIKEIGISNLSFHSLRHTFATNCIRLGADYKTVSELLGHSSVNITLNIYVHPQLEQKKKCINSIYKDNNFYE